MKGLHRDRMYSSQNNAVSIISLPGASVDNLTDKVRKLHMNTEVRKTIVHTGINDTMGNRRIIVTQLRILGLMYVTQLRILCDALQNTFPTTRILLSSTVPPRYRFQHHLADNNNTLMQSFCKREKLTFINHTPFFTSQTGARKKLLYTDQIHTSKLGTSLLAKNINPDRARHTQNSETNRHRNRPFVSTARELLTRETTALSPDHSLRDPVH